MGYLKLTSPAFDDGQLVPLACTRDAENVSPPLDWSLMPAETRQFALIMDDPDAPGDEPFVHWVVFAIPREMRGLPRGVPRDPQIDDLGGLAQAVNDFGNLGYDGPAPPPGTGPHRYRFELFALDRELQIEPKVDHKALRAAMAGKILDRAMLVATYESLDERVHGHG